MAEVLHDNLEKIEASDVHARLGLEKGKYILLSAHREENIDTEKNFTFLFIVITKMMKNTIGLFCILVIFVVAAVWNRLDLAW